MEGGRHVHERDGLAVAFRPGHAEVVLNSVIGGRPLLVADDANALAVETPEAAHNRAIFAEFAIPGQRREICDQRAHVIQAVGPLWMTGDLRLLPGRQPRIEFIKRRGGLGFEPRDLLSDGDRVAGLLERAQLLDLSLKFRDGFFEVEIAAHYSSPRGCRSRTRLLSRSSSTCA